jgi:cytochrome c oxidase subunit 3
MRCSTRSIAPWLGGEGTKVIGNSSAPGFENAWPTNGPSKLGPATTEPSRSSGVRPAGAQHHHPVDVGRHGTIAHHALRAGKACSTSSGPTFLLGFLFVYLQATEYHHAYTELRPQAGTGVYGSTFFMLTGFHGFHVTLGAIMLVCIWLRT